MKKYIISALMLALLVVTVVTVPTFGQTSFSIADQIARLQVQIAQLTAQLNALLGQQNPVPNPNPSVCYNFQTNLRVGSRGPDVRVLHQILQREGFGAFIDVSSDQFTRSTSQAVTRFQTRYGIPDTGYVGRLTRARLNALYGCDQGQSQVSITPASLPTVQSGQYYNERLRAQGFVANRNLSWSIVRGALPQGLILERQRIVCITTPCPDIETFEAFIAGRVDAGAGNYSFTVRVTNGIQTAERSYVLTVIGTTNPPTQNITVLFPRGGERWVARSVQPIAWRVDRATQGATVDLYLDPEPLACVYSTPACLPAARAPYVLDKNIAWNAAYNWIVATDIVNNPIPAGDYRVRVCHAGTNSCDSSDAPFTIVSSTSQTNQSPVIQNISGPTSLRTGQTGTWRVTAYDPEGEALTYNISWTKIGGVTANIGSGGVSPSPQTNMVTTSFSTSGVYVIQFTVTDPAGRSSTASVSVNVQ